VYLLCFKHSSECLLLVTITFVRFQVNEATTTVFSFAQLIFKFSAAVLATDKAISGTHAARARETKLATMIKDGSVTEKEKVKCLCQSRHFNVQIYNDSLPPTY
jgi:hypothetical protein